MRDRKYYLDVAKNHLEDTFTSKEVKLADFQNFSVTKEYRLKNLIPFPTILKKLLIWAKCTCYLKFIL